MISDPEGSTSTNPIKLLEKHGELTTLTFTNTCEDNRHYIVLEAERPIELTPYFSLEEWEGLKMRMNFLGRQTMRNYGRAMYSLAILVPCAVALLIFEIWRDPKRKGVWEARLFTLVTIISFCLLCTFILKLIWIEINEHYQRKLAMHDLRVTCTAYSDLLKSRGCLVELEGGVRGPVRHIFLTFRKVPDSDIHKA